MLNFRRTEIGIFGIILLAISIESYAVPEAVVDAANTGLPRFFRNIPANALEQYGFPVNCESDDLALGTPFQLYTILPSNLLNSAANVTVDSILDETSMWYFPVLVDNQPCSLLCVDQVGEQWKAVSLGYGGLAKQVSQIRQQWPATEGYNPKIIAVFQAKQFLFTVPEYNAVNLTIIPISKIPFRVPAGDAAVIAKPVEYKSLDHLTNTLSELRPIVIKNLNSKRKSP